MKSPPVSSLASLLIFVTILCSRSVLSASEVEAATLEAINTGPVHQLEAVRGSQAELPCDVAPVKANDRFVLVLWYKDAIGTPIYRHDTRGNSSAAVRDRKGLEALGGRMLFDVEASPSALVVDDLRREDQGLYRCRVDFKLSPTRNARTNLTVIIPPDTPEIKLANGQQVWTVVGPFDEGERLELTCKVLGGVPVPEVRWRIGHKVIDDEVERSKPGLVVNQLTIEKLERSHLHAGLVCEAVNSNYSVAPSTMVTVELNLPPLTIQILRAREPISANKVYDMVCQSAGARPAAEISWWLDEKPLTNSSTSTASSGNVTVSTLEFKPKATDTGKNLRCKAQSLAIDHPPLIDFFPIDVYYTPEVHLDLGSSLNPDSIREGEDVYFECEVKAKPKIYKVIWYHNGDLVIHNVSAGIIVSNQSLVLQAVNRMQTGLYTCIASNSEGDGESNAVNLNVQYTPVCVAGQILNYSAARHEEVTVSCQIDAVPPLVEFKWRFNSSGDVVEIADTHIVSQGLKSSLSYVARTELDYGTLQCWGSNSLGKQKTPCRFRVIPAERPDPPKNCSFLNDSTDSLTLRCYPGYNGGLGQTFVAEVYDSDTEHLLLNITDNANPYFQLVGLEAGTSFFVNIYSMNTKGASNKVFLEGYTDRDFTERRIAQVRHHPMSHPPKRFPFAQLLGIGLGVLGSLVLFIVVAVLLHRMKVERRRPKLQKNSLQTSLSDCRDENPDVVPNSDSESTLPCVTEDTGFHELTLPPPAPYSTSLYTTLPRRYSTEKVNVPQNGEHRQQAQFMYSADVAGAERYASSIPLCGSLPRGCHMPSISSQVGKIEKCAAMPESLSQSQTMLLQMHHQNQGARPAQIQSQINLMTSHHPRASSTHIPTSCLRESIPHSVASGFQHSSTVVSRPGQRCTQFVHSPTLSLHNQHLIVKQQSRNDPTVSCQRRVGSPQYQQYPNSPTQQTVVQPSCCQGQCDNRPCESLNTISYAQAHSIPLSSTCDTNNSASSPTNQTTPHGSHSSHQLISSQLQKQQQPTRTNSFEKNIESKV